jgi:hypothetical protein
VSDPTDAGSGEPYLSYMQLMVAAEDDTKNSLEQRALNVISTSGVLASLLFGLMIWRGQPSGSTLGSAAIELHIAAIAFAIAALAAVVCNMPLPYTSADSTKVLEHFQDSFLEKDTSANERIAVTLAKDLKVSRSHNRFKATLLFVAQLCEVVAIVSLAVLVVKIS